MLAAYLVMKNNLKRCFQNKTTYLLIFMIPVLISIVGMISINFSQANVKIGTEGAAPQETFANVTFVKIKKETVHTDLIMGKYDYILKGDTSEDAKNIKMLMINLNSVHF